MIDLLLSIEGDWVVQAPFVVRLRRDDRLDTEDDAHYTIREDGSIEVRATVGSFSIRPRRDVGDLDENVLAVFPSRRYAWRLIRPQANSNTLLLTEECDQRCVMCSQPPKAKRYDYFDLYARVVKLAPRDAVIGISGGEPTLLKEDLLPWLERMTRERPDVRFHILSNGQHFDNDDLPALRRLAPFVLWGIPLYGSECSSHDSLVSKEGAFEGLMRGLDLCANAAARVELRTVVMQPNLPLMPRLASFVARHLGWIEVWAIMQLERIGYARMNWDSLFSDTSRTFGPIGMALRISETAGVLVSLYNFPRCTVPEEFRHVAAASISDWKRKYLPVCRNCAEQDRCGGFFEWQPEGKKTFEGVRPL